VQRSDLTKEEVSLDDAVISFREAILLGEGSRAENGSVDYCPVASLVMFDQARFTVLLVAKAIHVLAEGDARSGL